MSHHDYASEAGALLESTVLGRAIIAMQRANDPAPALLPQRHDPGGLIATIELDRITHAARHARRGADPATAR